MFGDAGTSRTQWWNRIKEKRVLTTGPEKVKTCKGGFNDRQST